MHYTVSSHISGFKRTPEGAILQCSDGKLVVQWPLAYQLPPDQKKLPDALKQSLTDKLVKGLEGNRVHGLGLPMTFEFPPM